VTATPIILAVCLAIAVAQAGDDNSVLFKAIGIRAEVIVSPINRSGYSQS
jgi:hypothetical protein